MTERDQLEQAIAAQESLRGILSDAVIDATITALREKLASLDAEAHPASEQRKLVTMLFADTVASTAMSERLDPEDVMEIMNGALRLYTEIVDQHGGLVARLMGDGLLAFFGAPSAQEDDAVRAVRCGLAIVQAAQRYARTVEERFGVAGYNVRVGLNTGLVALGEVGSAAGSEYTAMGDAINLASRVESAAPPGSVLITHDTYRHVSGLFEVRTLDPVRLKGKGDPVRVYVVEREKPRTFGLTARGVEGIQTRMVGRAAELRQLQSALDWAIEESETQVVTILGEPGVGKSRLLREFDHWVDEHPYDVFHFTGRATSEMLKLPYSLIRNVFVFRFDIQDSDSTATVREKLERGIANFMGEDSAHKAHYIGQMIGFDFSGSPYLLGEEPARITQFGQYYLTEFFAAVAARHPVVMFLEDIHWADDKSLDLINFLVRSRRDLRLLVVCLSRPTLLERRPPLWNDRHEFHTLIKLGPLAADETREMVRDILRLAEQIPDDLCDLVVENSDGNPFYVEELIKMLIDDGIILKGEGRWQIMRERLTDLRIPPTLTGVLQARLDALPPAERLALQRAAVVGRIFWDSAITHLRAEGDERLEDIDGILEALRKRELIRRRERSAFAGTQEYIFKNTILRDVTYESVLRRLRRIYHAQVAEWLIEHSGDRVSEYTGLIAECYECAGDTRKAASFLIQAGQKALDVSAYAEAITLLERGLELLQEDTFGDTRALQAEIKWLLAQGQRGLSVYGKAKTLYEESLALFKAVDNQEGVVKALYELGWLVGYIMRCHDDGEIYFQQALTIARDIGDKRGLAWALNGLGVLAGWQNRLDEAVCYYEESLALARETGDQTRIAGALNNIGLVKKELGLYDAAQRYLEESLSIFRAIGNRAGVASPLTNLGELVARQGDHEQARQLLSEALAIYNEIGNRAGAALTLVALGWVARLQGDYPAARSSFEEALAISRAIEYSIGISWALDNLALVARFQGDYDEAYRCLHEILKIARELDARREVAYALIGLGGVARIRGDYTEARRVLEESLKLAEISADEKVAAAALDNLGRVALETGRYDEAQRCFEDGLAIYREFEDHTGMVIALNGMGDVAMARGDYVSGRELFYEAFTTASKIRDTPLTLYTLTAIAGLLAKSGEAERSLEMLGLVLDHPGTPDESRRRAQALLMSLRAELAAPTLSGALARGRMLKGVETIRQLYQVAEDKWLT